jgi:hypothetical protein
MSTTDNTPLCERTIEYRDYVIEVTVTYADSIAGVLPHVSVAVWRSDSHQDDGTADPLMANGYTVRDQNTIIGHTERVCTNAQEYVDQRIDNSLSYAMDMNEGVDATFDTDE